MTGVGAKGPERFLLGPNVANRVHEMEVLL